MHFVYLGDGYIESGASSFGLGNWGEVSGLKPGYNDAQIMANTGGNEIRSYETQRLRNPNNGMRSEVEWRRVEGRLDAKRQQENSR